VLSTYPLVLEQDIICARDLLEQGVLLVIRLEDAVLVRSELLEFSFEDLAVLIRDRLFVEDEHIGDVIVVHLHELDSIMVNIGWISYLLLEILEHLLTFLLDQP